MEAPMDSVSLTYDEVAERFAISGPSARNLVRRKRWARTIGNDGRARIAVPLEALPEAPTEGASEAPSEAPIMGTPDLEAAIAALRELVEAERRRADAETARVADLIVDRDRWHALAVRPWWKRLAG
jgi:hypothetical protein